MNGEVRLLLQGQDEAKIRFTNHEAVALGVFGCDGGCASCDDWVLSALTVGLGGTLTGSNWGKTCFHQKNKWLFPPCPGSIGLSGFFIVSDYVLTREVIPSFLECQLCIVCHQLCHASLPLATWNVFCWVSLYATRPPIL